MSSIAAESVMAGDITTDPLEKIRWKEGNGRGVKEENMKA